MNRMRNREYLVVLRFASDDSIAVEHTIAWNDFSVRTARKPRIHRPAGKRPIQRTQLRRVIDAITNS